MSGSYASSGQGDAQGIISDSPLLISNFLFASRSEPGYPSLDPGGSSLQNGLLTSGSWTYEGVYKFQGLKSKQLEHAMTQSLARLCTTGF